MSSRAHIHISKEKIAEFCRKWKITELALFGSVLRNDFRPDSDVDVLVTFEPDTHYSLFDLVWCTPRTNSKRFWGGKSISSSETR